MSCKDGHRQACVSAPGRSKASPAAGTGARSICSHALPSMLRLLLLPSEALLPLSLTLGPLPSSRSQPRICSTAGVPRLVLQASLSSPGPIKVSSYELSWSFTLQREGAPGLKGCRQLSHVLSCPFVRELP